MRDRKDLVRRRSALGARAAGAALIGLGLTGCGASAATEAAGASVGAAPVPASAPAPAEAPSRASAPSAAPNAAPVPATPAPAASAVGIYTAAQAAQGQQVFRSVCSACHGVNEFTGPIFRMTWMADPVGNLFQHISVAMPQDRPGALEAEEYAAVVAYFLQLNGRPAGETALPTDPEQLSRLTW